MSSGCARAVQPAAPHSRRLPGAGTGKPQPHLRRTGRQPRPRRPPLPPPNFGRRQAQGGPQARPSPQGQDANARTLGPTHATRAGLWNPPSGGDKGAREELPGAGARSPRGPSLEREAREVQVRRGANPPPPNSGTRATLTGAERPDWRGPEGRFFWGPARGPQLLPAPVAGGSWEDSPDRGLGLTAAEALPARRSGGLGGGGAGTPAPRSSGRGGPPPASGCGEAVALAAAAKATAAAAARGCPYPYRPARSASRPNVVIGRVAASLGPRSRGESSQPSALPVHVPPRPRAGRGHAPLRHVTARGGGARRCAPRGRRRHARVPGCAGSYGRSLISAAHAPAHPRAAAGCEPTAAHPAPGTCRGGACGTGRTGSRPVGAGGAWALPAQSPGPRALCSPPRRPGLRLLKF